MIEEFKDPYINLRPFIMGILHRDLNGYVNFKEYVDHSGGKFLQSLNEADKLVCFNTLLHQNRGYRCLILYDSIHSVINSIDWAIPGYRNYFSKLYGDLRDGKYIFKNKYILDDGPYED